MKKLIPALCMLLVAATLLGTSTYAWFSMNTSVTATGMSVKAQAPTSLLISKTSAAEGFASTVELSSDTTVADKIVPSHYNTKMLFAKLTDAGMKLVDQSGADTGDAAIEMAEFIAGDATTFPTGQTYIASTVEDYYSDVVWIKYEGETGTANITLQVDYTASGTDKINEAMHVVLVAADGTVALDYDMSEAGSAKELVTLTANAAATQYTVYYFLDGEDAQCKNSNILADNTLSVTLTFAIKP